MDGSRKVEMIGMVGAACLSPRQAGRIASVGEEDTERERERERAAVISTLLSVCQSVRERRICTVRMLLNPAVWLAYKPCCLEGQPIGARAVMS